MIRTECITDTASFLALESEWSELLGSAPNNCLFLSWEWMFTWWSSFSRGRTLCIITVRRDRQLVAIAPLVSRPRNLLRLQPVQALEFIGSGDVGSDYLSLLIRGGFEAEALSAISNYLTEQNLVLDFSRFSSDSAQMNKLIRRLRDSGWESTRTTATVCPYISLEGKDWEGYVASLGRSHRANVRKRIKSLEKRFNMSFKFVDNEADRQQALDNLVGWHLERWKSRGGSTAMHKSSLVDFHHDFTRIAMEKGWLRLFMLKLDSRHVASLYCFNYNNKYYFYQMGFDEACSNLSVGLASIGMAIRLAIEEGASEFDFLHGDERYKYLWTREERELLRIDLYPPGLSGMFYKKSMNLKFELKKAICYAQSLKTV